MAKYHREEYEIHRLRMIMYGLFEGFIIALQFHYGSEKFIKKNDDLKIILLILAIAGVPVILQLVGLYYIKSIRDPISGISKLDCLEIVSIN